MEEICRICGNKDNNTVHRAREMMFGTRDEFRYLECAACGTLQLMDIPDLAAYYPADYYSLDPSEEILLNQKLSRRIAARFIGNYLVTGSGMIGRLLSEWRPLLAEQLPQWLGHFPKKVGFNSKILDFGSGSGKLLKTLRAFGFRNLTGADAFIEDDIRLKGISIFKRSLEDLEPVYDVIMLHHSLEHLPDPKEALKQIARLLGTDGIALIRIPLVNYAWEKYGVKWVQLDPPRHLFLFTENTFHKIAEEAGLQVIKTVYDSEAFQFFGSEQYLLDIPVNDPRSFRGVDETSIFSQQQIDEWERKAGELNKEGRGDQACFYLRRA